MMKSNESLPVVADVGDALVVVSFEPVGVVV
jgi:hypothetical protein